MRRVKFIIAFIVLGLFLIIHPFFLFALTPTPTPNCNNSLYQNDYSTLTSYKPTTITDEDSFRLQFKCNGNDINVCANNYYDSKYGTCSFINPSKSQFIAEYTNAFNRVGGNATPTAPPLGTPAVIGPSTNTISGTVSPSDSDNINKVLEEIDKQCGGEDLQCCTPDVVKIPDIDVGLPIFDYLLNMAKEKLLGWMIGPQIDTLTTVYEGTDARLCVADFEPQIVDGDGNELMVKNQYNIIDGNDPSVIEGEYIIESYVNSQGTPIPTPEVTRIPNTPDKVKSCTCKKPVDENSTHNMQFLCKNATGDESVVDSEKYKCIDCTKKAQMWTALGCINMKLDQIIQKQIFGWGIGLAGVSALLCIMYSAFILQSSANNPEKIKHAQEMMTSCITGLIIIIFSVFILNVIGVDILRIPGFARPTPTPTPVSTGF